jgi:hypothetical protein
MSDTIEKADRVSDHDDDPRCIDHESSPSAGWRRVYLEMEVFVR